MFGIGWGELLCLLVFGMLCAGAAVLFLLVQLQTARNAPRGAYENPPPGPQPRQAMQRPVVGDAPAYMPTETASSVAIVARIAERFCPRCRAILETDSPEGLCPACLMAGGLASALVGADGGAGYGSVAATSPPGQASAGVDHDVEQLQALFPHLEILELLGRGGMGTVYRARQRNLDRVVALKVIPPAAARDPEFAERFAREARALARLNHPNIVTVYDFGQAGDVYYLLMEYVDGVNLRQTLRAGRLQPDEALAVVPQICDALQYAHDQGVVHRDIKPENVLLDRSGRIKIADFGLAKLLGRTVDDFTLTRTQQVMGTPRYMAPEQIERPSSVDHRADIYSLGVVIYEMLTGELPVGRFPPPSQKVRVDVGIDEVVLRSLEKEPDLRYQRASELKSGLATAAATMAHAWSGPRFPTPSPVYVRPKPPQADSRAEMQSPFGYLLLLAAGMVVGCLLITIGVVVAAIAPAMARPMSDEFGGWMGAAFGLICGGAGSLIGSYNSYRQLAGAVDLLRSPRITWFDWLMRGYLALGVICAAFAVYGEYANLDWPFNIFAYVGTVVTLQGILFLGIRWSLRTPDADDAAPPPVIVPSLWWAAGAPTLMLALVWLVVILDVFYATPSVMPDEEPTRQRTFYFYQTWQLATLIVGTVVVSWSFALLALLRSFGRRTPGKEGEIVEYPFDHPAWLVGAALIGLASVIVPWMQLEHVSKHVVPLSVAQGNTQYLNPSELAKIVGVSGGSRYVHRTHLASPITMAMFLCAALGGIAFLPSGKSRKLRATIALLLGISLFMFGVMMLHQIADHPAKFISDSRTLQGINSFVQRSDLGLWPNYNWSQSLAEGVAVKPALGIYLLIASSLLAIFVGVSGLCWLRALDEVSEPALEPVVAKLPKQLPLADVDRARELVQGPAIGLLVAGACGLLFPLVVLALIPSADVVASAAMPLPPSIAAAEQVLLAGLHPWRLAQDAHLTPSDYQRQVRDAAAARIFSLFAMCLVCLPPSILMMIGGLKMRRLESYGFAIFSAVVACIPCSPAWVLGLPMGIWAIFVLQRPEVKRAFDSPRI